MPRGADVNANIGLSAEDKNVTSILGKIVEKAGKLQESLKRLSLTALPTKIFAGFRGALDRIAKSLFNIKNLVAAIAFGALMKGLLSIAKQAGEVQRVRQIFDNFAASVRSTNEAFRAMAPTTGKFITLIREASFGLLSATEIARQSTKVFSMMGAEIGVRLPEMFRAATIASVLQGKSVEKMMRALAMGSGRLYNAYFMQLGIILDLKQAYAAYAKEQGKSVDAITRQEKTTAALNMAMALLEARAGALGDANLLLAMRTEAIRNRIVDLKDNILEGLAPAFAVLAGKISEFVDQAAPKIESFVAAFLNSFYQMGEGAAQGIMMAAETTDVAASSMGRRAAQWAHDALSWGANVGSEFGIGILQGFTAVIVFVMNTISGILSHWFGPGSPPKVAPLLDKWGASAAQEFFEGMTSYTPDFQAILDALREQLGKQPQQHLLEWGVEAIAEWAKGLSIFDLSFLQKQIDMQLRRATDVRDMFTKQLKKEKRELFRLQILNKDPEAIKQKLAEVKASEDAVDAAQKEVDALEARKKEIREQLDLFRLLARVLGQVEDAVSGAGGGGGAGGGAGGGILENLLGGFDFEGGAAGNLKAQMTGFAQSLSDIFDEPLENLALAWEDCTGRISTAWDTLKGILETSGVLEYIGDPAWAETAGYILGASVALLLLGKILGFVGTVLGIVLTPIGILLGWFAALGLLVDRQAQQSYPNLISKLDLYGRVVVVAGKLSEALYLALGFIVIAAGQVASFLLSAASGAFVFMGALSKLSALLSPLSEDCSDTFNTIARELGEAAGIAEVNAATMAASMQTGFSEMLTEAEKGFAGMATAAESGFGEMGGAVDGWMSNQDSLIRNSDTMMDAMEMKKFDYSEYSSVESANIELVTSYADMAAGAATNLTNLTTDTGIFVDDTEDLWRDLRTDIADTLVPDMMSSIEDTMTDTMDTTGTAVSEDLSRMGDSFFDVETSSSELLEELKTLQAWASTHTIDIDISWPDKPDYLDDIVANSPPPLAVGAKLFNEQLRETARLIQSMSGSRIAIPAMAGVGEGEGPTIVTFNEPIVGQMIVPNMQVGKQMVAELSTQIGERAFGRRMPT